MRGGPRFTCALVTTGMIGSLAPAACGLSVLGEAVGGSDDAAAGGDRSSSATSSTSSSGDAADARDASVQCDDAGKDCTRVIFLSSAVMKGNFGGIVPADQRCNALAQASTHPRVNGRKFVAWLGTASLNPANRIDHRGSFVRPDGAEIAKDWKDLTDATALVRVEIDENGAVASQNDNVWTGVANDGTTIQPTCAEWTSASSSVNAMIGLALQPDEWTQAREESCDNDDHIYCIEE